MQVCEQYVTSIHQVCEQCVNRMHQVCEQCVNRMHPDPSIHQCVSMCGWGRVRGVYENRGICRIPLLPLKISNRMKKSLMSLVVIYYNLKTLKISYQNGRYS